MYIHVSMYVCMYVCMYVNLRMRRCLYEMMKPGHSSDCRLTAGWGHRKCGPSASEGWRASEVSASHVQSSLPSPRHKFTPQAFACLGRTGVDCNRPAMGLQAEAKSHSRSDRELEEAVPQVATRPAAKTFHRFFRRMRKCRANFDDEPQPRTS